MSKDKKVRVAGTLMLKEVIGHLQDLQIMLEKGQVELHSPEGSVRVSPPPVVKFEMSLADKKDKQKLDFQLSWKTDDVAAPFRLGSQETSRDSGSGDES